MIENEFARHIKYCKHHDIDPTVPSKREILIQEVYDAPLDCIETRGKYGEYIVLVKPLLLTKGSFRGTLNRLLWELGLFKTTNDHWTTQENHWKISFSERVPQGRIYYDRTLCHISKQVISRGLDSLEKDGIINLKTYYCFRPIKYTLIDGIYSKKILNQEVSTGMIEEALKKDENTAITLVEIKELCQNIRDNSWFDGTGRGGSSVFPEKDNDLILKLITFMKQYAYKLYEETETLPTMDELPNEYDFFRKPQLNLAYRSLIQASYPYLIGCEYIWKGIAYGLTEYGKEYAKQVLYGFDIPTAVRDLSCRLLSRMGRQMKKIKIWCQSREEYKDSDFLLPPNRRMQGDKESKIFIPQSLPLWNSVSAYERHKALNALYDIKIEPQTQE